MADGYINYDIIIGGGGAAGLSLAYRLANQEFSHLNVLLIEAENDKKNDRTWCSWLPPNSIFDDMALTYFESLEVKDGNETFISNISPYRYRMIRSSDFYGSVHDRISQSKHIVVITEKITSESGGKEEVLIQTEHGGKYTTPLYFKSFANHPDLKSARLYVDQHFGGWFVKFKTSVFDPRKALFMDFSIEQGKDVRFMYALPYSPTEALIELAVFSNDVWNTADYDQVLQQYIYQNYSDLDYEIVDTEYGVIPMTDYNFTSHNSSKIIHIGAAGGAIKPSTGFAFSRIQRQCDYIITQLRDGKDIQMSEVFSKRHKLYDKTMLDVILSGRLEGKLVFMDLFRKNKMLDILRFLDEDTSILEELKIMSTCDVGAFGKGFWRSLRTP